MDFLEEYAKNKNEILKEFYGLGYAEKMIHATLSERTKAALYLKGKVQDVLNAFLNETVKIEQDNPPKNDVRFAIEVDPLFLY